MAPLVPRQECWLRKSGVTNSSVPRTTGNQRGGATATWWDAAAAQGTSHVTCTATGTAGKRCPPKGTGNPILHFQRVIVMSYKAYLGKLAHNNPLYSVYFKIYPKDNFDLNLQGKENLGTLSFWFSPLVPLLRHERWSST